MNTLLTQLSANKELTLEKTAVQLAEAGERENIKMHKEITAYCNDYPHSNPLYICIIKSLFWADYLKENDKVLPLILDYFEKNNVSVFEDLQPYLLNRARIKNIKNVVQGWKLALSNIPDNKLTINSVDDLIWLQERIIRHLFDLFQRKKTVGVGEWFCLAPLFGVAVYKKEYWKQTELDELIPPLGFQVKKGLNWVSKKFPELNCPTLKNLSESHYEGMNITCQALFPQQKLAKLANSRVVHINTGLWLLGAIRNQ